MTDNKCILCESSDIEIKEKLDVAIINKLYKSRANISTAKFFKQPEINVCKCNSCELLYYSPQILGDGAFYEELQNYEGYYLEEKTDYLEASKYVKESDNVLEIGCGAGFFTNYIKAKSYTGIEYNDQAISIAQSKNLNVVKQSIQAHALDNFEKYDVVCFFQVLEHIDTPNEFIQDALKCLKKGGKLIFAVPAEDSFIADAINLYLNMPPHHVSKWKDKVFEKIAQIFNIKLLNITHEPLQPVHEEFYFKVNLFKKIRKMMGISFKSLDNSLLSQLLYVIVVIISKIKKNNSEIPKIGQSVIAIYDK